MMKVIHGLVALCVIGSVHAHYIPMIDLGRPEAPPTLDPGPDAALLRVSVNDAATGQRTSATVSVNNGDFEPDHDPYSTFSLRNQSNRHKGPIRFRNIPYYFFTDGRFDVRVPAGTSTIQVGKGYEYALKTVTVTAGAHDTIDVAIDLHRSLDMASLGWYSGDTHIHMHRRATNDDTLLTITSAKDVRYAYLLSMNTGGYDHGGTKYESVPQEKGLGDASVAKRGPYHISSGHEYRTRRLGHVTIDLPDRYVPANGLTENTDAGPSLGVIADQAHKLNGFIGLAHGGYHLQEADALLLDSKMDFLELLQFGGYRSLGLDGWYDLLNIGYRLPIVGASDYPPTRELSSEITYVWSDKVPTARTFLEGITRGESFATSGPMLFATVGGLKPGGILSLGADTDTTISVEIEVVSPIYPVQHIEVIKNGHVIDHQFDQIGRTNWTLVTTVAIDATSWVAVRAYGNAGTESHTNPVYIYVGQKHRFDANSARNIITRLDGSMARIEVPEVIANITRLKTTLLDMLDGLTGDLPPYQRFPKALYQNKTNLSAESPIRAGHYGNIARHLFRDEP
jgi:hypothetical protein